MDDEQIQAGVNEQMEELKRVALARRDFLGRTAYEAFFKEYQKDWHKSWVESDSRPWERVNALSRESWCAAAEAVRQIKGEPWMPPPAK
jgi:hypothetical protein